MTEQSNSFFMQDNTIKVVNLFNEKEYLAINNVRKGKWKVIFKNNTYSLFHNNLKYRANKLQLSKKTHLITNKNFLIGFYSSDFYSFNKDKCENVQVNKIMSYFYHKNYFEFSYLKNKSKWFLINYYSISNRENKANYNCLQGGLVMSLPIDRKIELIYYYEHGEVVKIDIKIKN